MLLGSFLRSKSSTLRRAKQSHGFTIVELTVVIIVIGILATLTVISYNVISQQSRSQTLANDLQATASQLKKYKGDQGSFPSTLSAVTAANATTKTVYNYYYRPNSDSYCLQGTAYNVTMRISSDKDTAETNTCTTTTLTATNLARDPQFTTVPSATFTIAGITASRSIANNSSAQSGTTYLHLDINSSGPSTMSYALNTSSLASAPQPNTSYTTSLSIRPTKAMLFNARYAWTDSSGNPVYSNATAVSAPANIWTRFAVTSQFFSVSNLALQLVTNSGSNWSVGDDLDIDSLMVTQSAANYDYADGTSSGWSWLGTANNAASSGPAKINAQPVYQ